MMDAIVQFFRNGLFCIKDLELFQNNSTVLWDASYTRSFYDLPPPLDQTTPLEVLISICQFYAFCSTTLQGYTMVLTSFGKLRRIQRFMAMREKSASSDADRIINASLLHEAMSAIRSMFIGFNVFFIGFSFFWLTANSWHVTEMDWIGGVQALIHALTVMEICLLPLLYYMYVDAGQQFVKAKRLTTLAATCRTGTLHMSDLNLAAFQALSNWVPVWEAGVHPLEPVDADQEAKAMAQEVQQVKDTLQRLVVVPQDDNKEAMKQLGLELQDKADNLEADAVVARLEGYREYLYFVINCIAFYGYLIGIVVYYWDDELKQPKWIQQGILLGMNNTKADWHGNFVGDLMWTIEPIVILFTPRLFERMKPKKETTKVKSD